MSQPAKHRANQLDILGEIVHDENASGLKRTLEFGGVLVIDRCRSQEFFDE